MMETKVILGKPDAELVKILQQPAAVLAKLKNLIIGDDATYQSAAAERRKIKTLTAQIDSIRVDEKKPVLDASRTIDARYKEPLDYLKQADIMIGKKLVAWDDHVKEEARKEQERQNEIARKAEDKRRAVLAEQEARQREKERIAREEQERLEREAAMAKNAEERERLAQEAEKRQKEADRAAEEAEKRQAAAEAVQIDAPVVMAAPAKAEGTHYKDQWRAEVVDLKALIDAVAAGRSPEMFILANQSALDKQAKATKDLMPVAGVKFWNDRIPVSKKIK